MKWEEYDYTSRQQAMWLHRAEFGQEEGIDKQQLEEMLPCEIFLNARRKAYMRDLAHGYGYTYRVKNLERELMVLDSMCSSNCTQEVAQARVEAQWKEMYGH